MSRVDEALRRAQRAVADVPVTRREPVKERADLLADLPCEASSREPEDPWALGDGGAPSSSVFAMLGSTRNAPTPSRGAPEGSAYSLLQRIDARVVHKTVIDHNIMPASREQYRKLAASLHQAQLSRGTKVMMIASAAPGEGKTLTASNLALTFSESYQRSVLLIDADLRKPTLHTIFQVENRVGLSDGLALAQERSVGVRQLSQRLALLPAGEPSVNPMAGLTSDRMRRLLEEAREAFDWVIIDTPPVAFLSDAALLASMVDAAVLVVKAGLTPFDLVRRAVDVVGRDRLLGVVLNRAEDTAQSAGYAHYQGYYERQPVAGESA